MQTLLENLTTLILWEKVIVNSGKQEEVIVGEIDTSKIQLIRKKLPYLKDSKIHI